MTPFALFLLLLLPISSAADSNCGATSFATIEKTPEVQQQIAKRRFQIVGENGVILVAKNAEEEKLVERVNQLGKKKFTDYAEVMEFEDDATGAAYLALSTSDEVVENITKDMNEYMASLVKLKAIYPDEARGFRAWVKNSPPEWTLNNKTNRKLYDRFAARGMTMADYYDFLFLKYVEAKYERLTPKHMQDYLKKLPQWYLLRLYKSSSRVVAMAAREQARNVFNLKTLTGTVLAATVFSQYNNIVNFVTSTATSPVAEGVKVVQNTIKTETIKREEGGQEKVNEQWLNLKTMVDLYERVSFKKMDSGQQAVTRFTELESFFRENMPNYTLVQTNDAGFDDKWKKTLLSYRKDIKTDVAAYTDIEKTVSTTKIDIEKRKSPATEEELTLLAKSEADMARLEESIGKALASWYFYREVRGANNPLEKDGVEFKELDEAFASAEKKYFSSMDLDKLKEKHTVHLKEHLEFLKKVLSIEDVTAKKEKAEAEKKNKAEAEKKAIPPPAPAKAP